MVYFHSFWNFLVLMIVVLTSTFKFWQSLATRNTNFFPFLLPDFFFFNFFLKMATEGLTKGVRNLKDFANAGDPRKGSSS